MPKKEKYTTLPAVIDVETTGLFPAKNDIIEIAVVIYDPETLRPTTQRFHKYVKPDPSKEIDQEALNINHIDLDSIPEENTQEKIAKKLIHWISEQGTGKIKLKPLGHNYIVFDILFLKEWLGANIYDENFHYRTTDTCQIARVLKDANILPIGSCSLKSISEYYGIPKPPHNALEDALTTLDIYAYLLNELHPTAEFRRGLKYYLNILPNWIINTWNSKFTGAQE
jgi:DNA polymerase III epsilon subunit-like protein